MLSFVLLLALVFVSLYRYGYDHYEEQVVKMKVLSRATDLKPWHEKDFETKI